MDCMEGMKEFPDKYFDLAIVDPPYGGGGRAEDADAGNLAGGVLIGRNIKTDASADDSGSITLQTTIKAARTGGGYFQKYKPGGLFSSANIKHWDVAPGEEYFKELAHVSKNQII